MEMTAQTSDRGKEARSTLSLHVTTIPDDYLSTHLDALSASSRVTSPKGSSPSLKFDKVKVSSASRLSSSIVQQETSLQKRQNLSLKKEVTWMNGQNANSSVFSDSIQNVSKQVIPSLSYPLLFDILLPLTSPSFHKEKADLRISGERHKQGDSQGVKGVVFSPFPAVSATRKTAYSQVGSTPLERKRRILDRKDVVLHRLAVEFNSGARIRMTRRGKPRLRSLLYRSP